MLPSETMIWQPEFTDKTLSETGAVQSGIKSITEKVWINNLFRIQNQICYPRWNTKTYAAVSITTDTDPMMNHLYEQLTALKLTGFRDALKKQLAQRAHTGSWASKNACHY
ncbi:hypothetical protein ECZU23_53720 [Escherichia coli]|nr:hypothetical protein ECZU23_53720 [Escherichia coli]